MKQLKFVFAFIGLVYGQAYAIDNFSFKPYPIKAGQEVDFGIFYMCGQEYSNPSVTKVGSEVNLTVSYHNFGCPIGVPTPEGYKYFKIGAFSAGGYQLNLTIVDKDDFTVIQQETIPFGVLAIKSVPVATNFMYFMLTSLTILFAGFWFQKNQERQ